jgi:glycine cleavage system aminomethyltransferase T
VTSSDTGHFLGKTLVMAYVPPDLVGATVNVTSAETADSADGTVTDRPFYDPDGTRLRA